MSLSLFDLERKRVINDDNYKLLSKLVDIQ